jgi:hypothetical protein
MNRKREGVDVAWLLDVTDAEKDLPMLLTMQRR